MKACREMSEEIFMANLETALGERGLTSAQCQFHIKPFISSSKVPNAKDEMFKNIVLSDTNMKGKLFTAAQFSALLCCMVPLVPSQMA